jgi:hypothetical protein
VLAGAIGAAQAGSETTGFTAAIGVGAGRGAAGLAAAGRAALGADFFAAGFTDFFAAFRAAERLAAGRFALTARLALRLGARRATARFLPLAFDFFFAFLFLAISSSPEQVCSSSVRFRPTPINLHDRTPFAKYGVHAGPA